MTRQQRKQIEREFYNYKANRDKAANHVASHAYDGFGMDYSEPRVQSSPGNSVEDSLIRAISQEERAWKWCIVFQKTMERFLMEQKDELMRRRYILREHYLTTCTALCMAPSTYFYWVEDILNVAYKWAVELKIF